MKKIKLGLASLLLSLGLMTSLSLVPVLAATPSGDACDALQQLDNTRTCDGSDKGVSGLVATVVNLLSYIVGIVAVIMIIIAGLKYVTASGDPNNVNSAKNTLIYALVGVVIAALAQFLVHFVLSATA